MFCRACSSSKPNATDVGPKAQMPSTAHRKHCTLFSWGFQKHDIPTVCLGKSSVPVTSSGLLVPLPIFKSIPWLNYLMKT